MVRRKVTKQYKEKILSVLKEMCDIMGGIEFNDWQFLAEMVGVEYEPIFKNTIKELDKECKLDLFPTGLYLRIEVIPF